MTFLRRFLRMPAHFDRIEGLPVTSGGVASQQEDAVDDQAADQASVKVVGSAFGDRYVFDDWPPDCDLAIVAIKHPEGYALRYLRFPHQLYVADLGGLKDAVYVIPARSRDWKRVPDQTAPVTRLPENPISHS